MTRDELLLSARKLRQPPPKAADEFSTKREFLASQINQIMSERGDITGLIGENNIPMMFDNHRNHARFIESMFIEYRPEVLVETVLWVFRAYRSHGFNLAYWPAQLDTWVEIFKKELTPATFQAIEPFYNWMIVNQPAFTALSDKMLLAGPAPLHECVPGRQRIVNLTGKFPLQVNLEL